MTNPDSLATIQVDLDGLWVVLRFLGHQAEDGFDPFFESGLVRILDLLGRHRLHATFFVNAVDLGNRDRRKLIERVAGAGHELANHGFDHTYLSRLPYPEKARQISESTRILDGFLGRPPRGFRAPGYDLDGQSLSLLQTHGYLYDSSIFPTSISPFISIAHGLLSGRRSQTPWPRLADTFAPSGPYRPLSGNLYRGGGTRILEIPVSVFPILRLPLTFSYGALMGRWYFRLGLRWVLKSVGLVNFLFHLVDFAEPPRDPRLRRLPIFWVPLEKRLALADEIVGLLQQRSRTLPTGALCGRLSPSADAENRQNSFGANPTA